MKNRKTYAIVGGLLALCLLGVGTVAYSWGPGIGCHPKFRQMMLAHLDDRVEEMGLNQTQQKQYQELRNQLVVNMEKGAVKRRQVFRELSQELNKAQPDVKAMAELIKLRLGEAPAIIGANLDLFTEFYQILDKDQKAKFIAKARKKMARAGEFCLDN